MPVDDSPPWDEDRSGPVALQKTAPRRRSRRRLTWLLAGLVGALVIAGVASGGASEHPELAAADQTTSSSSSSSSTTTTTATPVSVPTTQAPATTTTRPPTTTTTLLDGPCRDDHATSPAACAKDELALMDYWKYVARTSGTSTLTLTLTKGSEPQAEDVCSYTKIGFEDGPFENKIGVAVRSSAGSLLRQSGAADTYLSGCFTDFTARATTTTTFSIPSPSYTTPTTPYIPPSSGGSTIGGGGGGSCTYVDPYYREDGTHVRGHWRGC